MRVLWAGLIVVLVGCGGTLVYVNPNVDQVQADRDRYECMKESRYSKTVGVPTLGAWNRTTRTYGAGGTLITTQRAVDETLYDLCMRNRGYTPQGE